MLAHQALGYFAKRQRVCRNEGRERDTHTNTIVTTNTTNTMTGYLGRERVSWGAMVYQDVCTRRWHLSLLEQNRTLHILRLALAFDLLLHVRVPALAVVSLKESHLRYSLVTMETTYDIWQ